MNIIHYSIQSFLTNEYYSIIRFASKRLFVATLIYISTYLYISKYLGRGADHHLHPPRHLVTRFAHVSVVATLQHVTSHVCHVSTHDTWEGTHCCL